jgi:predicted signal transduction protein with EAL and GGDEF domain
VEGSHEPHGARRDRNGRARRRPERVRLEHAEQLRRPALSKLPLDLLKVDRSFIERVDHAEEGRAITYAIVSLANALGVRATGEGIETPKQLAALIEVDCQYGQGHLLGKPVPADEFAALLLARRRNQASTAPSIPRPD